MIQLEYLLQQQKIFVENFAAIHENEAKVWHISCCTPLEPHAETTHVEFLCRR